MFTQLYGLETVTIRYFNVFGPRQDPSSPYSGVISLFISALCDGTPADHLRRRRTHSRLHLRRQRRRRRAARVQAREASGEVINVATGGRISLNQLFQTVRDLVDADVEPIYDEPRAGDVKDSQADIGKAQRLLGYARPSRSKRDCARQWSGIEPRE